MRARILLLLATMFLVCTAPQLISQSAVRDASSESSPLGFSTIKIGMALDEVKLALESNSLFRYRGDPDVSLLPRPNEFLIETEGIRYIDRAYFQFYDGALYTIILLLNREEIDHFTLYTTFVDKYGEPTYLDPSEVVWEFEAIRLAIERPLSVKYVDTVAFEEILRENAKTESLNKLSREGFLGEF